MKKTTSTALLLFLLASCFLLVIPASANASVTITNPNDVYSMLPETFTFASGAGGWWTDVHISADGTFTGLFIDSDMGDRSDEYPDGTRYECYFSGSFTDVAKVNDFEYSMRIATLQLQGTEGEEKIVEGVRIITGNAYGFDDADEFRIYLPGIETKNLPEAYLSWVGWPLTRGSTDGSASSVLTFYGLYNVGGEQGFYSDDAIVGSYPSGDQNAQSLVPPTPLNLFSESSSNIIGTITATQSGTVSVRNRPSEDGNRLVRISAGESCPCVGQDASGWYKVYYNNYIGYVPESAVAFSAQDALPNESRQALGVVKITSNDFANIRSAPNQNSDWLAGVSPGISVDYVGVAENGWYCIVLPSGQTGYVSNKLCGLQ